MMLPPNMVTPTSTSSFRAMVEATTSLEGQMQDRLIEIAVDLRKLLMKARGSKMPALLRPDLMINARRVSRQFSHAAKLHEAAAQAERRGYRLYTELFTDAGAGSRARSFDVDR
jgi:hypothetical protein